MHYAATHRNTLQHTAIHCSTLQHTAAHCNTLQHTATLCNTLQHTAAHCNTLQHAIFSRRQVLVPLDVCMGWLRWVGASKLQVSFAEYRLFDRALLQKRPTILRRLLTKANPYEKGAAVLTTIHCNTLQHTATHCTTLHSPEDVLLPLGICMREALLCYCEALLCSLQHTIFSRRHMLLPLGVCMREALLHETMTLQHSATHCNTLQQIATHCNTLQHTSTHCNTLQHTATHCNTQYSPKDTCFHFSVCV